MPEKLWRPLPPQVEKKKRKREVASVLIATLLFLLLTWVEFTLFKISSELPFVHSIFFFGLVNFNIVLLMFLLFMIFRNVVKSFVEKKGHRIRSLKGKLIASFVAFSFIPTTLMFFISVFYINSSFDKWFSVKVSGVLKSSLEITNSYYLRAKKQNYHFAHQIATSLGATRSENVIRYRLTSLRKKFSLDSVEYYPSLLENRILSISQDEKIPIVPRVNLDFLEKGIVQDIEGSTIHPFSEGNLVRVIVPVRSNHRGGAIVVSSFIPLSLISKMNEIADAYDDFRNTNQLEYPIKSIYLVILFLMTLVILLGATWFGFYLARQLSIPLVFLGEAARQVASGKYETVDISSGSEEISQLVDSFNQMTLGLAKSENTIRQANAHLKETLDNLDKHNQYVEVVLDSVNTGVVSVDQKGYITTINNHAGQLLKASPEQFIGRHIRDLMSDEYYQTFSDLLQSMKNHGVDRIQKEVRVNIDNNTLPMQMTLSILYDSSNNELGKILVFDDLTILVNAQRAAAWRDVARRIAHEIKNPLTPIKLSAQRLQKKFGTIINDTAFDSCTKTIIEQVDDLKSMVNEFSNFAKLPQSKPVQSNLNEIVQEVVTLYLTAHKDKSFHFSQNTDLPSFKFDPQQIKRAIINLLDNAIAAFDNEINNEIIVKIAYNSLLKIVQLSISDNGKGVPTEERGRIFEPYFTTKKGGTGLGLAIVKRIIEDHNGFIRAYANEPKGTKIMIELPVISTDEWKSNLKSPIEFEKLDTKENDDEST